VLAHPTASDLSAQIDIYLLHHLLLGKDLQSKLIVVCSSQAHQNTLPKVVVLVFGGRGVQDRVANQRLIECIL
jgi:hypothetical protein